MSRIPHAIRVNGRYAFRRRIHSRNLISKVIKLALKTSDPTVARQRAAVLSARFEVVKSSVVRMIEQGAVLTGEQVEKLFRDELECELRAIADRAWSDDAWAPEALRIASDDREMYRILRSQDRHRPELSEIMKGLLPDDAIVGKLNALGATSDPENIANARIHLLRARAVAGMRSQRLFDDDVMDASDPVALLMSAPDKEESDLPALLQSAFAKQFDELRKTREQECEFKRYDTRKFSEFIDEVANSLKSEGIWSGDLVQQRRIMRTFAWITGDRELGSYNYRDVASYKRALFKLPKTYRFGSVDKGPMSRPFQEVIAEVPQVEPAQKRSNETVARDLSTMSTVAKYLRLDPWKPSARGETVMDFAGAMPKTGKKDKRDARPVWQTRHMECLFNSPIYTGNRGAKKRLRTDGIGLQIWHDAAYFAPLLLFYTLAAREEICGLEVADIFEDHPVPHLEVRDNLTRGTDGEMAGLKNSNRHRKIPIHPEIIRLGFLDYVRAIAKEGHTAVFPELYLIESKRGGAFFYDRAWRHMVDWIEGRMELPAATARERAGIHSIRALGSSFFERADANPTLKRDLMGHSREGTDEKHYSKRIQSEGMDVVLLERLEFILKFVPIVSEQLRAEKIRLLPLNSRSRVGSALQRKPRGGNRTGER